MTGNKDTVLAASVLLDILKCPRHSFGSIFYISRILSSRTQTIIDRYYREALICQFFGHKLASAFHTTTVKPYDG